MCRNTTVASLGAFTVNFYVFSSFRLIGDNRETEKYCRLFGVPAQTNQDSLRYKRAAFYSGIKGKVRLIFAKAAALRIDIYGSSVAMGRTHITHCLL